MNIFSKVISLGLLVSLLVAVPVFAGKHDERDRDEKCCYDKHKHDEKCCNDKHDRDENCSIVGAYTILSGLLLLEMELHNSMLTVQCHFLS